MTFSPFSLVFCDVISSLPTLILPLPGFQNMTLSYVTAPNSYAIADILKVILRALGCLETSVLPGTFVMKQMLGCFSSSCDVYGEMRSAAQD
ncbi:hypothetical protein J3E74DRAFT_371746 [Bipolaris maydis]|nr:hypothetical protein J3E74DRAFT_395133 [Bipolaris maydis]KAJ5057376.1 hypothetical protein J3E74DRAFT_371746 [Bipolaris maydis]